MKTEELKAIYNAYKILENDDNGKDDNAIILNLKTVLLKRMLDNNETMYDENIQILYKTIGPNGIKMKELVIPTINSESINLNIRIPQMNGGLECNAKITYNQTQLNGKNYMKIEIIQPL